MALKIETTIRNMSDACREDFMDGDYDILMGLEEDEIPVVVDCIVTDGYYDITTPTGREIAYISHHHLDGFSYNGPMCLSMD